MSRAIDLSLALKQRAMQLGFDQVGICPAVTPAGIHRFMEWLAAGYAGEMAYLTDRAKAYEHPRHVLHGARSLVMLTMNYCREPEKNTSSGTGRISQYAWGTRDYHDVIHDRLKRLVKFLKREWPESNARGVVDTAPLLEREFAQMAGLGWVGKNTMLISPQRGSWFFLAALLTDVELEYDEPFTADHCGTCRACLDACPTDAFPTPYVLDATQCISYLTIELRDTIPATLRNQIDDWVFGCDICQEVCPWNRHAPGTQMDEFQPRSDLHPLALTELFDLDENRFRARFHKTPLWRTKRRGLLRNAAIVLGNQRDASAIEALGLGLCDEEPLVRSACAWALGQIPHPSCADLLSQRLTIEEDEVVRAEIESALEAN